jgi:hypothetical protein
MQSELDSLNLYDYTMLLSHSYYEEVVQHEVGPGLHLPVTVRRHALAHSKAAAGLQRAQAVLAVPAIAIVVVVPGPEDVILVGGVAVRLGAGSFADLVRAAQQLYPKKAGKIEQHHIEPLYLGGAQNGLKAPLDAAYHQLITNAFRRLAPYGAEVPSATRVQEIMRQVYEKYPLPPGY